MNKYTIGAAFVMTCAVFFECESLKVHIDHLHADVQQLSLLQAGTTHAAPTPPWQISETLISAINPPKGHKK